MKPTPILATLAIAVVIIAGWVFDVSWSQAIVAGLFVFVIARFGWSMISGLAQPVPEPPDPGELRKVKLGYRCAICGAEVRMTVAASQEPEPPRHCLEDMDLVTPLE